MTQLSDGTGNRNSKRLSKRVRTGDIIVVILFLAIILMLIQFNLTELFALIYNPVAGLVLLIIIVEFLWLKSGDRTRIYKLEIDKLRKSRRDDEELLRRTKTILAESLSDSEATTSDDNRPGDWRRRASDLHKDLEDRL
ncbi:MAG: hypothetical protein JJU11_04150 [Candidatus Sumerlaeia bacterium]|nr:hypothetical protein [Candidatus Sumerlaeia bacterium]